MIIVLQLSHINELLHKHLLNKSGHQPYLFPTSCRFTSSWPFHQMHSSPLMSYSAVMVPQRHKYILCHFAGQLFSSDQTLLEASREDSSEYYTTAEYFYYIWYCTKYHPRNVILHAYTGIILGLGSVNERRRYIVTPPLIGWAHNQIILSMSSANERRCYIVTPSLIGQAHIQNDPCL